MEKEIWKDVKDFEGLYKVSNLGRVKRLETTIIDKKGRKRPFPERILKIKTVGKYYGLQISKEGVVYPKYIHRLVAQSFIANPKNKPDVNHIDGDKSNNNASNLEWVTKIENMKHAFDHKLINTEKPINQFTLKGEFVKRFKSMMEASRQTGVEVSNIQSCARGEYRHASGFQWVFDKNVKKVKDIERLACRHNEGVVKLTLKGEYICEYDKISQAYEELGKLDNGVISQVCKGDRKRYLNFKWMYKKDYYKNK